MIIEIKDLPEGRKVSRILVDVTFEDNGTTSVSQTMSTELINETIHKASETPVETSITPEIKRVNATNPSIPVEMLDMEF